MSELKPMILCTSGIRVIADLHYQILGRKYMDPLIAHADVLPVIVPTCFESNVDQYLDLCDGLFLSGATSNINPELYGQNLETPNLTQDPARDLFDQAIMRRAFERKIPVLGVCRGFQEINIFFGGDLHQKVHETPGLMDHREENPEGTLDEMYGPNHEILLEKGTWFHELMGVDQFKVNSLHGQGVKTMGKNLLPLAYAPDGLLEAYGSTDPEQYLLAVQWHPEWKSHDDIHKMKIFESFGDACRRYKSSRNG